MDAGTTLTDEATPAPSMRPEEPRRFAARVGVRIVGGVVVAGWALFLVGFVQATSAIDRLQGAVDDARAAGDRLATELEVIRQQQGSLERDVDAIFDPAEIVGVSDASVFSLLAGGWQGSAFVLSSDDRKSRLVTNFHVVRSAWNADVHGVVVRNAGSSLNGTIIDVVPDADLAIVEVPRSLPALDPDLGRLEAGEPVVVVGSPYGYAGTVSTGVVSAIRRRYVQFSAPVSPGSSGGPVLDGGGRVIGVAAAKVAGPGAEGLSFAIPIDRVCRLTVAC